MKKDYIPDQDLKLQQWEQQFLNKVDGVAAEVGADMDYLQKVKEKVEAHRQAYADMRAKQIAAKAAATHHRQLRNDTVKLVRKFCNHLKVQTHYTTSHGKLLNMIGHEVDFDARTASPRISARVSGQQVVVRYNKPRAVSGIRLYCRRGSETGFTLVNIDSQSPCYDPRPNLVKGQPEERQYYAVYYFDDSGNMVGQHSPVTSVLVNL